MTTIETLTEIADFWSGRSMSPGDTDKGEYAVTYIYGDDVVRIYGCCLIIAKDAKALLKRPEDVVSATHDPKHGATIVVRASAWSGTRFKMMLSDEQKAENAERLAAARGEK